MQPLDFIAAGMIALLTGMGVGSGGLFVIYLTLIRHLPQLTAQGFNLLFFLSSAGGSLLLHIPRRKIRWSLIALLAGAGAAGAWLGAAIAPQLHPALLRRLFGGMLVLSGCVVLFRREKDTSFFSSSLHKTAQWGKNKPRR